MFVAAGLLGAALGAAGGLAIRLFFPAGPEGWEFAWLGESWVRAFFTGLP